VPKPRQKAKSFGKLLAIGREWVPRRSATITADLGNEIPYFRIRRHFILRCTQK
jgi:hypothetical protein